jgi:hypothetical protein
MKPAIRQKLSEIAAKELGNATLETYGRDHLDFHEVSVWSLAEALSEAYKSGHLAATAYLQAPYIRCIVRLIKRADDLIAPTQGTTDQFETEVARLKAAVTKAEQVLKGGAA